MYDVTTTAYRQKVAQAVAAAITLPIVSTMVFGTGGVDANGNPLQPTGAESALYNQVLSKGALTVSYPTTTSVRFTGTINPTDLAANTNINEIGLKDNGGNLVAHSCFTSKPTDGTTTMTFNIDLQF